MCVFVCMYVYIYPYITTSFYDFQSNAISKDKTRPEIKASY
jgi:hypothetical protein